MRASKDLGKTWGPIGIAGPALPTSSTNYPGAFLRDSKTIALRYCTDHGVSETTSTDEGSSWSQATNASQPVTPRTPTTGLLLAARACHLRPGGCCRPRTQHNALCQRLECAHGLMRARACASARQHGLGSRTG